MKTWSKFWLAGGITFFFAAVFFPTIFVLIIIYFWWHNFDLSLMFLVVPSLIAIEWCAVDLSIQRGSKEFKERVRFLAFMCLLILISIGIGMVSSVEKHFNWQSAILTFTAIVISLYTWETRRLKEEQRLNNEIMGELMKKSHQSGETS